MPSQFEKMEQRWKLLTADGAISGPQWQNIQEAVSQMDGEQRSEVILELHGKGSLFVEGGNDGRYLVVYFPDNHSHTPSLTLTDISQTGSDILLTVQTPTEYAAKHAVKQPLVLHVIEHCFQTGEVPKDVRWELDNTEVVADL